MMKQHSFLGNVSTTAVCLGVLLCFEGSARATAPQALPPEVGKTQVEVALSREAAGQPEQRAAALERILADNPQDEAARWQSGQVKLKEDWVTPEAAVKQFTDDEVLDEYRNRRDRARDTYFDQLRLANWCRDHKLPLREKAHLTAVLRLARNPNDPALRARLGQVLVGNMWMTREELEDRADQLQDRKINRRKWLPQVRKLATRLKSRRLEVRSEAKDEFKSLPLPDAIPALEAVMGTGDLQFGRLLVDLLKTTPGKDATASLSRLAVLSNWDAIRAEAGAALRQRQPEEFAPGLLVTLHTPTQARYQIVVNRRGVHTVFSLSSESAGREKQLTIRSTRAIQGLNFGGGQPLWTAGASTLGQLARSFDRNALRAQATADALSAAVERQNEQVQEWNERVCSALAAGTGLNIPADPQKWWEWWQTYNQLTTVEKAREFYTLYDYSTEQIPINLPTETEPAPRPARQCECLVAGTPVWTDRGLVAVEEVKAGDLVLSKDAETGQLDYQPVLATTRRNPEPTWQVETDRGSIRATGAHTFWISGLGWRKLRDAKPGQFFHGHSQPVKIRSLTEMPRERTYNLVVSEYHTYFVGTAGVLSHDVTFSKPVDNTVPGLSIHLTEK